MNTGENRKDLDKKAENAEAGDKQEPQWASGLKAIYDSVLEEPLPDKFKDLLSKLDDGQG